MPLNSWTCLFFPVFDLNHQKKRLLFTLLYYSYIWLGLLTYPPQQPPKLARSQMEAMAGRLEKTARPGCTSYSLRSENHQLPSNSDWVEKHLKKPPKNILQQQPQKQITEWAALLHKQPLKHKKNWPKKELFKLPKTKWRHTKRNYTLCIARILYPAIIIDRNHVNFQNDRPKELKKKKKEQVNTQTNTPQVYTWL